MSTTIPEPQNLAAEENVIGAIMLSNGAIDTVAETLTADDFYRQSHAIIYQAALALAIDSQPIDGLTLAEKLETSGKLKAAGGRERIRDLAALVPSSANVRHYAQIVSDTAAARRLARAGQNIARLGYERPGTTDELMALAEEELSKATGVVGSASFSTLIESGNSFLRDLKIVAGGGALPQLDTGFNDLDHIVTIRPGQLVLLAARPGEGKSALAQNIAENIADQEQHVAFLSLEMSGYELLARSLARAAKQDLKRVTKWGQATETDLSKMREGYPKLTKRDGFLHVNTDSSTTPTTLRAQLHKIQRHQEIGLLVVDYIQLMTTGKREENRQVEVASISRSLKLIAKSLNIPVLALSQMSRRIDFRAKEDRRPTLSDLRESGALEQDADSVLFIHREEKTPEGEAELIVAKNRMGETSNVRLLFVGRHYSFLPLAKGGE